MIWLTAFIRAISLMAYLHKKLINIAYNCFLVLWVDKQRKSY